MNNQCHMSTCRYNHKAECISNSEYKICTDAVKSVLGEDRYNLFLEWEKLEIKRKGVARVNEIERAIGILNDIISDTKDVAGTEEYCEAVRLAIEALEKQIPKQVTIKHSKANLRYLNCPTCDTTVKFSDNYCKICGQALKGV